MGVMPDRKQKTRLASICHGWLDCSYRLFCFFWLIAGKLNQVRTPANGDQASYLDTCRELKKRGWFCHQATQPILPDSRNHYNPESIRQPLLPLILSLSASQDLHFFLRAKWWVWTISLLCLIVIYIGAASIWGRPVAFMAVLLLGLNVHFQTFASEIWCENLLILWTTLSAFLIHYYFKSEKWRPIYFLLVCAGISTALAYYTKASAAALLISFTIICLFRFLADLRSRMSNVEIFNRSIAPFTRYALTFLLCLLPYLVINLVNTHSLLRNRDLQAAMWTIDRSDYYIPHESPPSPLRLFQSQPWYYSFYRFGLGLYLQAGNHLNALKISPFGDSLLPAGILLVLALWNLFRYPDSSWKRFVLILLGFNAVFGAWYVVIDIAPRFLFVGVPLLYVHAALGFKNSIQWLIQRMEWKDSILKHLNYMPVLLPVLFLLMTLVQERRVLNARPHPILEREIDLIYYLKEEILPSDVLLMGPSHQLPWNYFFDRRYIFVPEYDNWDYLLNYIDHFKAKYFLLDTEVYYRRMNLLQPYIRYSKEEGFTIKQPLPRMRDLGITGSPPRYFILFEILPTNSLQLPDLSSSGEIK